MPSFTLLTAYLYLIVAYVGSVLTLHAMCLLFRIPAAGFFARVLTGYVALLWCAGYGVYASAFLSLIGLGGLSQWATGRSFKWAMWIFAGVLFTLEDPNGYLENTRPAVFIGNHQTELDVLMLGTIFPKWCSVTAKSSLKHVPFLGWFMRLSGSIFIDRKNASGARQIMAGAANEIRTKKQSVYMFPEGTRSYSKEPMLLPFKKGAFHLAIEAGVPIVPIVVANYSHILWIKGLVFNSGKIPCKVLPPIPTTGLTSSDVEELARTTRKLMETELITLTAKARGTMSAKERAARRAVPVPSTGESTAEVVPTKAEKATGVEA